MYKRICRPMRIKKLLFACLVAVFPAAALSACGKEEATEAELKAFGIDFSEELPVSRVQQVICGQEKTWFITSVKNDYIYQLPYDSPAAGIEEIAWQPGEGDYFMINIAERNGTLYAEFGNREEDVIEVQKYREYMGWSHVMSVKPEGEGWSIMGSGLFVDSSENVYLVGGNTVARFEGEGKRACEYELKGTVCTFQEKEEGTVLCVTADTDCITLYELGEGGAEEKWTWKESEAVGLVYGICSNEAETLCLATNTELLFFDIESGSLSERADLVKLGVASVLSGYYDGDEGTLRLYGQTGNNTETLCYSLLSGRDAAMEQRTELVFGIMGTMNTSADSSIWNAIATFNQENERYYITIKYYASDNQERYIADLAAGNGPDIIDMTYFADNYDNYVKNGYLEDLSCYLEQSEYRDDIIWNVLEAYRIDGGLYMLVPQFIINGILIHPDYESQVEKWNIETFLELIEVNQWEKDILGYNGNPEKLLKVLLCGMQEKFIDREHKTASFENDEFLDILALCREYAEAERPDTSEWTMMDEEYWNQLCSDGMWLLEFYNYLYYVPVYGREYQLYGYPTLSGQVYGVSSTYDGCAIYAGSENKEGAWEFIESLLWDSNQRCRGIAQPGFPIRSSMLEELEEGAAETEIKVNGGELTKVTDVEIEIQKDVIYNGKFVNYSVMIDSDIWSVIQEETASYFAGDKSAEEVAHIIQSRVGIILGE